MKEKAEKAQKKYRMQPPSKAVLIRNPLIANVMKYSSLYLPLVFGKNDVISLPLGFRWGLRNPSWKALGGFSGSLASKAAGEIVILGLVFMIESQDFRYYLERIFLVIIVILELQECVIRTKVQKQKVQCQARDMLGLVLPLLLWRVYCLAGARRWCSYLLCPESTMYQDTWIIAKA